MKPKLSENKLFDFFNGAIKKVRLIILIITCFSMVILCYLQGLWLKGFTLMGIYLMIAGSYASDNHE